MPEQHHPDNLTPLYARLAAQELEIARLKHRRRFPRRLLPLAIVTLLVALMPLSILAAGPVFSDLGAAAPVHQPNIQAIGDAGITTGFADPNNPDQRLYDPKANVTREEMASFLARTAGLGGNAPVVNAKTAQTATNAASAQNAVTAQNAVSATNAGAVDGKSADELVRAARGSSENLFFSNLAFTAEESLIIVAPAAGYVLVNATVSPTTGGAASCPCPFHIRLVHTGVESPIQTQTIPAAGASASMATTWVFPVGAGPQTFQLQIGKAAGVPAVYRNPTLTAVYIPFGYNGGSSLAP
jgi:hypothetical protein